MKKIILLALVIVVGICLIMQKPKVELKSEPMAGIPTPVLIDVSWIEHQYLDILYAKQSKAQQLDIYLPNDTPINPDSKFPVIIAIHGGAFIGGDKRDEQVLPMLQGVRHGYAVVSINYRLSGESQFPAQINDVKAAIRFVKANANKYHLDPERIAVWGDSAGAHLAALSATSGDMVSALDDLTLGNTKYSASVNAVVDWYGPINFALLEPQLIASGFGGYDRDSESSPEGLLIGGKPTQWLDRVTFASPASYINPHTPPFLIQHGNRDSTVPVEQSINFHQQLVGAIGESQAQLIILDGAKHGDKKFETPANLSIVFQFLDKILK